MTGNIILDRMNSMSDAELLEVISKNDVPLLEDITDVTDNNEPE